MSTYPFPRNFEVPLRLGELMADAMTAAVEHRAKVFRIYPNRRRSGRTLRAGEQTPLWNELAASMRPYLKGYGRQVRLARLLGLPRQRVHEFLRGRGQMPDAERTLQMLAWVILQRRGIDPS